MITVKFTPIADRDTKTATIIKQVRERGGGGGREGGRGREIKREIATYIMTVFSFRLATCVL